MTSPRQRFGREQRLLTGAQFAAVFRNSRRSSDTLFTVRAHYSDMPHPRLGLAISKKHARHAVTRNRLKRQSREQFRLLQHDLAPADYVVTNHPAAAHATAAELANSLRSHFRQLTQARKHGQHRRSAQNRK